MGVPQEGTLTRSQSPTLQNPLGVTKKGTWGVSPDYVGVAGQAPRETDPGTRCAGGRPWDLGVEGTSHEPSADHTGQPHLRSMCPSRAHGEPAVELYFGKGP